MPFDYSFYFLRHGETHWNREGRTQGQLDARLNETGRNQAARAAAILGQEPIARIISSPLSRARDTAASVAAVLGLDIETDDDLMECHLGDHQGRPHGPWLPRYFEGAYDPPNGETFPAFCDRVWAAMERAVAAGPNTLIVAHGGLWIAAQTFISVQPPLARLKKRGSRSISPRIPISGIIVSWANKTWQRAGHDFQGR